MLTNISIGYRIIAWLPEWLSPTLTMPLPFLKVYHIVNQAIDFAYRPQFITEEAHETKGKKSQIVPGDVLMNIVGPPLGKVAVVPKAFPKWNCNQALTIFRPSDAVSTDWLYHFLRSGIPVATVVEETRGVVGQVNISLSQCRNFSVPIPPVPEQRRIVAKLDRLSARSSTARDHLAHTTTLATRAKQAVLASAFSGKMTASWRGTPEISEWKHRKSSEVCEVVQSGGTPKKDCFCLEAGVPFLKVYNIVKQKVAFDYKPQFITEDAHNTKSKKSKLKPGDVLMNIVGPPLGKVAIVPDTFPEWNCNQAITVFRPGRELTSAWIYHFLCSGISVDSVVGETRGVVGQVNISLTQCRNFVFPIPPKNEQTEIIRRIEAAFARIDRLTYEATRAAHLVDRLDERLLAKAFAGELVPQDPNDEPAEALLARIREARAAAPKPSRARQKKASA